MRKVTMVMMALFLGSWLSLGFTALYAQDSEEHTVSGTITNAEDAGPLPGVNIVVEGTTIGTTTDFEGNYELTVPSSDVTLVFTYIGFVSETVPVDGRSTIDMVLNPQAIVGEELVVVGYGAVERRDITGSVASISTDDIQERSVALDMSQVLQGRAAGVTALSSGGRPGQAMTIRVRGRRSLTASNDPLFVVDGIPLEGNIDDINPRDIQSMEVLKDASATAIYGSRGANGVILVTTARGGDHPTEVFYSGHTGISRPHGTPNMMNAEQFA
jgi:TonB-dependent SusC/RagA subfamily outer membrane receptor